MSNPHDKLLANAAKETLRPLGFLRKGRSRIWIRDHGWWLTVVEFQPSGWAKGSFLNVAAHWLWTAQGYLSFDYGGRDHGSRVEPFVEYVSDGQFGPEATRLARSAAREADLLYQTFNSIAAAATVLAVKERALPDQARGSWPAYHAGVAIGLSGKLADAAAMLRSVRDERVLSAAGRLGELLQDQNEFRREVDNLVSTQREALGLGPTP